LQFDDAGSLTNRYLSAPGASGVDVVMAQEAVSSLSSPGTVTWPLTDNLNSVRDVVDSTGAVIDHLVYNSFGQIASETNFSAPHLQGYAGGITDPVTGLVNFWHRWYDPATGNWLSQDPIGFQAQDANLSRYVGNDASNSADPTGLVDINSPSNYGQPGSSFTVAHGAGDVTGLTSLFPPEWQFSNDSGYGQPSAVGPNDHGASGLTQFEKNSVFVNVTLNGSNVCNTISDHKTVSGADSKEGGMITAYIENYPSGTYDVTIRWSVKVTTSCTSPRKCPTKMKLPDGSGGWRVSNPLASPDRQSGAATPAKPLEGGGTLTVRVTVPRPPSEAIGSRVPVYELQPFLNNPGGGGKCVTIYRARVTIVSVKPVQGSSSSSGGPTPPDKRP
jgi:RHS repeat-associated protein